MCTTGVHTCQNSSIWQIPRRTTRPVSNGPSIIVHRNAAVLREPLHRFLGSRRGNILFIGQMTEPPRQLKRLREVVKYTCLISTPPPNRQRPHADGSAILHRATKPTPTPAHPREANNSSSDYVNIYASGSSEVSSRKSRSLSRGRILRVGRWPRHRACRQHEHRS